MKQIETKYISTYNKMLHNNIFYISIYSSKIEIYEKKRKEKLLQKNKEIENSRARLLTIVAISAASIVQYSVLYICVVILLPLLM